MRGSSTRLPRPRGAFFRFMKNFRAVHQSNNPQDRNLLTIGQLGGQAWIDEFDEEANVELRVTAEGEKEKYLEEMEKYLEAEVAKYERNIAAQKRKAEAEAARDPKKGKTT